MLLLPNSINVYIYIKYTNCLFLDRLTFLVYLIPSRFDIMYSIAQSRLLCSGTLQLNSTAIVNLSVHRIHFATYQAAIKSYASHMFARFTDTDQVMVILNQNEQRSPTQAAMILRGEKLDGISSSQSLGEIMLIQRLILETDDCVEKKVSKNIGTREQDKAHPHEK